MMNGYGKVQRDLEEGAWQEAEGHEGRSLPPFEKQHGHPAKLRFLARSHVFVLGHRSGDY
jgi:hypothetical protein